MATGHVAVSLPGRLAALSSSASDAGIPGNELFEAVRGGKGVCQLSRIKHLGFLNTAMDGIWFGERGASQVFADFLSENMGISHNKLLMFPEGATPKT